MFLRFSFSLTNRLASQVRLPPGVLSRPNGRRGGEWNPEKDLLAMVTDDSKDISRAVLHTYMTIWSSGMEGEIGESKETRRIRGAASKLMYSIVMLVS